MLETPYKKRTLDEWLHRVSYSDRVIKNIDFTSKFEAFFLALFNDSSEGELEDKKFHVLPEYHKWALDGIIESSLKKYEKSKVWNSKDIILGHREFSKSTTFAVGLFLFIGAFNSIPRLFGNEEKKIVTCLYVADSLDNNGLTFVNNMKSMSKKPIFWEFFNDIDAKRDYVKLTNKDNVVTLIRVRGILSGIRGFSHDFQRPRLCVIDDVLTETTSTAPNISETIVKVIDSAITNAMDKEFSKILWLGTPFDSSDPILRNLESGIFQVHVFPICEKFPCTREEFKGGWEEKYSYDVVKNLYDSSLVKASFFKELMLQIYSSTERLVRDEDILYFEDEKYESKKDNYYYYITTDFAYTEKESSDYTVILVWAVDDEKNWILVEGYCKKQRITDTFNDLMKICKSRKFYHGVGLERSSAQVGFIDLFNEKVMTDDNCNVIISKEKKRKELGIFPAGDKVSRFRLVEHMFRNHKIKFLKKFINTDFMTKCLDQLIKATNEGFKSKNDDILDSISMIAFMNPVYPSKEHFNSMPVDNTELGYPFIDNIWNKEENNTNEDLDFFGVPYHRNK